MTQIYVHIFNDKLISNQINYKLQDLRYTKRHI